MSKEYLSLGIIKDSFGLDGTAKIISTTSFGKKRYQIGNKLYLLNENDNSLKEVTVKNYRHNGDLDFVSFLEINSKEEMESFKGFKVVTEKKYNDLEEGTYFYSDLDKCNLYDQNNNEIGKVLKVEEFPAQITLRCQSKKGKQFFVPFVSEFIQEIDIKKSIIKINVIEGML